MENLWEMIAKARGVELEEEFKWHNFTDKYRIRESGLEHFEDGQWYKSLRAIEFISGIGEIEKLPFRPRREEIYYTIVDNTSPVNYNWADSTADYARLITGLVFRTKKEAEAYIPTWQEKISKL